MYLFEGRAKGATWSLLLETLHNQGVYITANNTYLNHVQNGILKDMNEQGIISDDGYDYLLNSTYSMSQVSDKSHKAHDLVRRNKSKVYLDLGMEIIKRFFNNELGFVPEVMALGNDDVQVVHPRQIKELNNTYVVEQRTQEMINNGN